MEPVIYSGDRVLVNRLIYEFKTPDYGDLIVFKPNGNDINFEIFSEKRVNKDDKSGANIKIVNSSDKEVNLIINKDDEKSPRVNVTTDGKVKIIKN